MTQFLEEQIIFEDKDIIIVDKYEGVPTQSGQKDKRNNLYNDLQEFLNQREGKQVYLALHHRLDAPTRGLVLFCKNKSFNKAVTDLFREKKIQKKYVALVDIEKDIEKEIWTVENKLIQFPVKHFKKSKASQQGKLAITDFKLLAKYSNTALIECLPKTGRLHQIRVHLKDCGLPLQGDFHYNKNYQKSPFTLIAYWLGFSHPRTKELLEIKIDYQKIIDERIAQS